MSQNVWPNRYKIIDNHKFPLKFSSDHIKSAISFINKSMKSDDKLVLTYPKSGTTWTRQIIYLILNNGLPQNNEQDLIAKTPFIDTNSKENFEQLFNDCNEKKVFFSHFPLQLIPYNEKIKYLLILRNPKDVCVSYYYHSINRKSFEFSGHFHDYFNYWINGEIPYGDYFQVVLEYWKLYKQVNDDNKVTLLLYEHMKKKTRDAVLSIAKFVGDQYVTKLFDNNESLLNEVMRYSSVDYMKSELKIEVLVRKGTIGDWRTHFTQEQSERVDQKFRDVLNGTDLIELWKEDMKWSHSSTLTI